MDPNDRVAIITGGASGIGLATAKLLGANGAKVVIADLQEELGAQAVDDIAGETRFIRTDVTRRDELDRMLDFAVEQFGRIDIVHNNAGISEPWDLFAEGNEDWERTLAIDLQAVISATRLEVQRMRAQGNGGVIVNTASMGGLIPMAGSPVYAASKAGVIHFTRSLAYLGAESIRVNAVCPTFTDTPLVQVAGAAAMDAMKREVGGILQPEQVAEGVLELVRDDSRAGAVMRVTVRGGIDYKFDRR